MSKIVFLFLIVYSFVYAQNTIFNEPVISGTPLIPSNDIIINYLNALKKADYQAFKKITSYTALPQNVGDEYDFNVLNLKNSSSPKLEKKTFVLKISAEKIDIWVEKKELENGHVTDAVINSVYNGLMLKTPASSLNPQQGIYEIDTNVFGSPPDIDKNGKVEFLLTDIIDSWTGNTGGVESYIGGFFYPNDQNLSFPGSNKADILYIDTYPGIYQEDNGKATYKTYRALGTVAHEFQHLIQYRYDKNEKNWVNEGLSELASFLCGHGLRSPDMYLQNTDQSMTDWNDKEPLPHYSRVALWFYYLYEKFGLSLISHISQTSLYGIAGVNKALNDTGINQNFDQVIFDFFKTLSANIPEKNIKYTFKLPELQYLKVIPKYRIYYFPANRDLAIKPYSMQSVEFTNGNGLAINFSDPSINPVLINRFGFGVESILNESNSTEINDVDFGKDYHTEVLYFLNNTSSSDYVDFSTESETKYDIIELKYDSGSPTFSLRSYNNITFKGATDAIQYSSPRDTAILKSIKFYNSSSLTDLKIHLYQSPLTSGANPASYSFVVKNVVQNGWVSVDTEDFLMTKNKDETFNVGVEFLTDSAGAMGYEDVSGSNHQNKSFIKGLTNEDVFYRLNEFSNSSGASLNGTWMIRLEIAAPYTGIYNNSNTTVKLLSAYPNPFNPLHNDYTIQYELNANAPVRLNIYNILGQLVFSEYDPFGSGIFHWNGTNFQGSKVASGLYIASLIAEKNKINQRILLIY